jgi:hypothetical protein
MPFLIPSAATRIDSLGHAKVMATEPSESACCDDLFQVTSGNDHRTTTVAVRHGSTESTKWVLTHPNNTEQQKTLETELPSLPVEYLEKGKPAHH